MMRLSLGLFLLLAALLAQAPVPKKVLRGPGPDVAAIKKCWNLKASRNPEATACFLELTNTKDPALRAEGHYGLRELEAAKTNFEQALERYPGDPYVRIRYGQLFFDGFNRNEAVKLLTEALELDPTNAEGMLALAKILSRGFDAKAMELAEKAAEADPALYEAHELLARLHLENSDFEKATAAANKALTIQPNSLNALATLGTMELLKNKPAPQMEKIEALDPSYGEAWYWAGHHFVQNRRYEEAIRFYRKALDKTPDLHIAREQLGVNLMRLGQPEEARRQLEQAYNAGHHSNEVVNSLRLMDSYKNFLSHSFEGGEVRLHKKEADVLQPYFEEEVRRARAVYEGKYKMKLAAKLEVEVYPDHEDFAVRTLGMPGLGATGVSFGPVVAMDSPSARKPGEYHWASTLWHELSHSYILVKSKFLVPRWFTEGISVHEETQADPEWGDNIEPPMLDALAKKKFLPVMELDSGFVRPKNPLQVGLSYFQAGQALDWIVRDYGQDTVNAMVDSFAEQMPLEKVLEKHLQLTPNQFDEKLQAFLEARWGESSRRLPDFSKAMRAADQAMKAKNWDGVIAEAEKARAAFPQHVGPYELLGRAYTEKGETLKARDALRLYAEKGGREVWALKGLAKVEEATDNPDKAAAALQRLIYIAPLGDEDLHKQLGNLFLTLGKADRALPAFRAQLASKPVDPAGVYFNLARTYVALSRQDEAQEALFNALELAPGFKPAQKLLLELESKNPQRGNRNP
ncbi:MAG: tetratricopeptide repeat protein [Bryobacter sp.]|nr:tetratricopeptide repeat protein [Bryobacter sp.]